ncbi:hypothetical protein K3495_g13844 [Podosphaera aphanis]|nr:hypothetical protein K3495_g13844 [Podosphaera aphanis]
MSKKILSEKKVLWLLNPQDKTTCRKKHNKKRLNEKVEKPEKKSIRRERQTGQCLEIDPSRNNKSQVALEATEDSALYVALPWSIVQRRAAIHDTLYGFLARECRFEGLTMIQSVAVKNFVLQFEDKVKRDAALKFLKKRKFATSDKTKIPLITSPLGKESDIRALWTIIPDTPMASREIMDEVSCLILKLEPEYYGTIVLRTIFENDRQTGSWALGLFRPLNFSGLEEVKINKIRVILEPLHTCKVCGTREHSLFSCESSSDVKLGKRIRGRLIFNYPSTT